MKLIQKTTLIIVFLTLSGCAAFSSSKYSCKTVEPWVKAVHTLADGDDMNNYRDDKTASKLYRAFSDDIFKASFGKSYFDHSENELDQIYETLLKCHPYPWMGYGVGVPFQPKNPQNAYKHEIWAPYLQRSKSTSYASAVEQIKRNAISQKEAQKAVAENERLAKIERRKRMIEENKRMEAKSAAFLAKRAKEYEKQYGEYGDCAQDLGERLTKCTVGYSCDDTGCQNDTQCDKYASTAISCLWQLNTYGDQSKTYYCDTDTGVANQDRATVIKNICPSL